MPAPAFTTLSEAAGWFEAWLRDGALPLWASAGVDRTRGGFHEALTPDGRPHRTMRRGRVQARQVWVFATASQQGTLGDWRDVASQGFDLFVSDYRRPDGLFARLADQDGRIIDDTPAVYEQAFSLLAMAALFAVDPSRKGLAAEGARTRKALEARHNPAGGYEEFGDEHQRYQANAHMHLLEASLAWEDAGEASWAALSDEIVGLAMRRFIDPERGFLREFFDRSWTPLAEEGGLVEPGHQFEWAWLLDRWGRMREREDAVEAAHHLFANGLRGVDVVREVAVNALWEDLSPRDPTARLWPQTEHLKAALLFGTQAQALRAAHGLAQYLDTPARGAWRDKMQVDGSFLEEPSPATSFYHVLGAVLPLLRHNDRLGPTR